VVRSCGTNLVLTFVAVLVAILIGETGFRLLGVSYPSFYITDEHTGYALRAGAEGWYVAEGGSYIRINSAGLRDRERPKIKPSNTLRVAILGDSYAEALQVSIDDTFWAVLERELAKCPFIRGRQVEVLNFGVSGYGTAQELMTLRHKVWNYSPDIVLLAFLTGNDVSDNSRALRADPRRPYFVYRNSELMLDDSFRNESSYRARQTMMGRVGYWALNHFRVAEVMNAAKHKVRTYLQQRSQGLEDGGIESEEIGLDSQIYIEPNDPTWQEAWQITEELIVLMRDEVKKNAADFWVTTLSNAIQVHPDRSFRQAFMDRLGVRTLFYPELRIKSLGEREGFPVLNLAPKFQSYADRHKVFLHGFYPNFGRGHWNTYGHRLAGETIAPVLCNGLGIK
jgi:hypothetical protein